MVDVRFAAVPVARNRPAQASIGCDLPRTMMTSRRCCSGYELCITWPLLGSSTGLMAGLDNQAGHLRQKQVLEEQGRYATEDSTPRAVPLRVGGRRNRRKRPA
jgi:hypothetical protein